MKNPTTLIHSRSVRKQYQNNWYCKHKKNIKETIYILNESTYINRKKYNNFDNTLKLFTHRYVKQKVNDNITLYPDDNEHCNDNNDISFNEISIVYT